MTTNGEQHQTKENAPPSLSGQQLNTLQQAPGYLLRRVNQIHDNAWLQYVGSAVTPVQFGVLLVVKEYPSIDQRSISEILSLDRSSTADVVSRLSRRGWLRWASDAADKRRKVVNLTTNGNIVIMTNYHSMQQVQDSIASPLEADERLDLLLMLQMVAYAHGDLEANLSLTRNSPAFRGPASHLPNTIGHLFRRALQVHNALWAQEVGPTLTPVQYRVLLSLHIEPNIDQRTLGKRASIDKSTGADVVARLVSKGMLRSTPDPEDRRRSLLTTSPRGTRQLFKLTPHVLNVQTRLLRNLDPQRRAAFVELLTKVSRHELGKPRS